MVKRGTSFRLSEEALRIIAEQAETFGISQASVIEAAVRALRITSEPMVDEVSAPVVRVTEQARVVDPIPRMVAAPAVREPGKRPVPKESAEDTAAALFRKKDPIGGP